MDLKPLSTTSLTMMQSASGAAPQDNTASISRHIYQAFLQHSNLILGNVPHLPRFTADYILYPLNSSSRALAVHQVVYPAKPIRREIGCYLSSTHDPAQRSLRDNTDGGPNARTTTSTLRANASSLTRNLSPNLSGTITHSNASRTIPSSNSVPDAYTTAIPIPAIP